MWIRAFCMVLLGSVGTTCCAHDIHRARLALIDDTAFEVKNDGIAWVWTAPGYRPLQGFLRKVVEASCDSSKNFSLGEISSPALEKLLIDRAKVRLDQLENPILISERQLRESLSKKP